MNAHFSILDKISEVAIVVGKEDQGPQVQFLGVNDAACHILSCTKEDFLRHAYFQPEPDFYSGDDTLAYSIVIKGGRLFDEVVFQFEKIEQVFQSKTYWVLIGTFSEKKIPQNSIENVLSSRNPLDISIFYAVTDSIIITDPDYRILALNPAAKKLYDISEQGNIGKVFRDVIPTDYLTASRAEIMKIFNDNGGFWEGEVKQQTGNGAWIYVYTVVDTIKDTTGKAIGLIAVNRDISTQKEAEIANKVSEERLKLAGKAAYDLLYEWDVKTRSITWFGDIDGFLGYQEEKISKDRAAWMEIIHPEDLHIIEETVATCGSRTEPISCEYKVRHADGHYLTWSDQALPILNDMGKPIKWVGVCRDITKLVAAKKELEERDKLLSIIGSNFPKAYLSIIYPDLTLGYTNGQEFTLRGIDPSIFIGMNVRDVFATYGQEVLSKVVGAYQQTFLGNPQNFELTLKDQIQQYTTVPIKDDVGEISSILAVVRNVTEEREQGVRLRESEEKFSKAFHEHPVPMGILDLESGNRIDVNHSFEKLLGKSVGRGTTSFKGFMEQGPFRELISQLQSEKRIHEYPLELRTDQGETKHLLASGNLLNIGKGNLAIFSLVDISLKKIAEDSLVASEVRLRTLIETLPDLVCLKDIRGVFLGCNKRFCELYNLSEQEIIGKTDYELVSLERADFFRKHDLAVMELGSPQKFEDVLTFESDGHVERVETIKAPVYDDQGQTIGVLSISRDISDRIFQMERLEQQNKLLKEVIWSQSHGVRAPLSNIMGLIQILDSDSPIASGDQRFIHRSLMKSAEDLDQRIREITAKTQKYFDLMEKTETQ